MAEAITLTPSNDAAMTVPEPGLRRQVMSFSPQIMLVRHRMEKGWVGVRHSHPHEQMVYVVSGHISFASPDGTIEAKGGASFLVPGGVPHQATALEESEVLDIFTPAREDYAPPTWKQEPR
jgi:quercetin dioxygenase-like cupin family protein